MRVLDLGCGYDWPPELWLQDILIRQSHSTLQRERNCSLLYRPSNAQLAPLYITHRSLVLELLTALDMWAGP